MKILFTTFENDFILRFVFSCYKFYSILLFFVDNRPTDNFLALEVVTQTVAQRFRESRNPHECLLSSGVDILKIRRFVHSGRAGSIPARGTIE